MSSIAFSPAGQVVDVPAVRIKLGPDRAAPQPDPLGRMRIGYRHGLSVGALWQRGRGVWKARLDRVAEADLALIVFDDIVRLVGTVDGVAFHGDRVAVSGRALPGHPLIGAADPLANDSKNPIVYGSVRTPASTLAAAATDAESVLADAIAVLTEAARLRRPAMRRVEEAHSAVTSRGGSGGARGRPGGFGGGRWEPDPNRTEPGDWAEFVTLALAGAAANIGGVETALAGRSGSWEAEGVRQLLASTVGLDEAQLWAHRTDPVDITLYVDEILAGNSDAHEQYEHAFAEARARYDAAEQAEPPIDHDRYVWRYVKDDDGDLVATDPAAPAFDIGVWRDSVATRLEGTDLDRAALDEQQQALLDSPLLVEAFVPKSADLGVELSALEDARDARLEPIADLEEQLWRQQRSEWTAYGTALKARIEALAADTAGLDVPVRVRLDVDTYRPAEDPARSPGGSGFPALPDRIVDDALADVSTPDELPGTPLDRLTTS